LDKIYKTLFLNKPTVGEVTQVRTDPLRIWSS
jgi:hypothetical protein